jgi:hypothetical protein
VVTSLRIRLLTVVETWLGSVAAIFYLAFFWTPPPLSIGRAVPAALAATVIAIVLIAVLVRRHRRRVQVPRATASVRSDRAGR